eukprot:14098981-Alexandrium_andersonii.AAC.1
MGASGAGITGAAATVAPAAAASDLRSSITISTRKPLSTGTTSEQSEVMQFDTQYRYAVVAQSGLRKFDCHQDGWQDTACGPTRISTLAIQLAIARARIEFNN